MRLLLNEDVLVLSPSPIGRQVMKARLGLASQCISVMMSIRRQCPLIKSFVMKLVRAVLRTDVTTSPLDPGSMGVRKFLAVPAVFMLLFVCLYRFFPMVLQQ